MIPVKDENTTKDLMELVRDKVGTISDSLVAKLESMKLLKPSIKHQMGPEGKIYSRSDVANALRVVALSVVGFTPADAANYARDVKRFRQITKPFLKKALPELLDATTMLFVPQDLFPDGDPRNVSWDKMSPEIAEAAFDALSVVMLTATEVKARIDRTRKALDLARVIEEQIAGEFLPAIGKAIDERGGNVGMHFRWQLETIQKLFSGVAKEE